mmetsp:Transcript_24576/g.26450  ORF Transcript_24576/g.26450 Transcript_24576/m.26450 type:complete len:175 (+) Transcript_24576:50-574(+)
MSLESLDISLEDMLNDIDDCIISEKSEMKIRNGSDQMDENLTSQLNFIIKSELWFDVKQISDCFDKKIVDNGIIWVKEIHANTANSSATRKTVVFHYWIAYFGGNPTGYLIGKRELTTGESNEWKVLIENCDSDFIYRGGIYDEDDNKLKPKLKTFIKKIKQTILGDYYESDEE